MTEKNNERMSRRARYTRGKSVEPGGYVSRNIYNNQEKEKSYTDDNTIKRSAPSRVSAKRGQASNKNNYQSNNKTRYIRLANNKSKEGASSVEQQLNSLKTRISNRKPKGKDNGNIWRKIFKYGLYLTSIAIITIFLLCVVWIYQAPAFDSNILDNNNRTIVYDVNNQEVAKLGNKIGENVEMSEVPQQMQDAILATEDNRFFEHGAVDYRRLVGAVFSNLTSGFGSQGGSTISQQLIKRTFLDDNKSVKRKVQEAYLAYKLEQNYDKETIFNMYINRIYYSDGVYGLKTAANYYYGKELNQLTLPQMAFLAGMPQQPNGYNPYDHPENAKKRRDTVLYLMQYHGKITEAEAAEAQATDIMTGIVNRTANERYVLSSEFDSAYTAYMSQVEQELRNSPEFKDYEGDVLNLGLKVYTNLDTTIQKNMSNSMSSNLVGIKQSSEVAMVALNNDNSGIAALYGGRNFKYGGFNIATQSKLQPGSAIKPILAYAPAVEYLGWSTNHMINDTQIPGTQIQNWDRKFHGNVTMNYALTMSFNIPAIKTYQEVGFSNVKKYANSVGMEVTDNSLTTPIGGSADGYSPLQMAGAYVPFSNGGYYATPKAIKKVYDSEETELKSFSRDDRKQVIKDSTAYIMTSMLRNVVNGTAQQAAISGADMGVKTGTTTYSEEDANKYGFDIDNSAKDSWVVGYTSNYTLAVWQGFSSIDGPTKYLSQQDTLKTQALYKMNMQNIVNTYRPKSFTVPKDVGNYDGGIKVLTDSERRELEKKQQEEASKRQNEQNNSQNNNENNDNDNNLSNNRTNSSNVENNSSNNINNTTNNNSNNTPSSNSSNRNNRGS
ncbi:penicillin-binding protein [Gemella sp. GH3]|uniref:transglycosylase domain-containing protein n=1 Tax=unclassified Gemella TaxID=2624949 RepID=UPI0015D07876|nr:MULTISPECIES: transglycosylase domain-containing protein [unclassified Gemella]MBF0714229.1 penicillin-binding protein [Gemella sp. GH3.1]NYS51181.1 penicillin-binding protein [Gemella sp. GH3]